MAVSRQKFNVEDEFELPQKSRSSKGSEEKDTEHNRVAELGRNRGTARRQAQETAKDPNEADRLEIEAMKARVEQFDSSSDTEGSSLTAKQNGQGDIELNLKFNVPLESGNKKIIPIRKNKFSSAPATNTAPNPSLESKPTNTLETEPTKEDFMLDEPNLLNNDTTPLAPEPEEPITENVDSGTGSINEENASEDETGINNTEEANTEDTESEEKKSTQGGQVAENASFEIEKEKKEQEEKEEALKQQEQEQREGMARAAQEAQKQAQQQQSLSSEYAKAVRKKQDLDRKLNRLKMEKMALTFALYTAKTLKAFIDVLQSAVKWLAGACMSLVWTIILGILGIILYIFYAILFIPERALWATIKLIEAKIKSINEDIKKTKENQQKAISVIQSIQRKKRTGTAKPAPKFNVPQKA